MHSSPIQAVHRCARPPSRPAPPGLLDPLRHALRRRRAAARTRAALSALDDTQLSDIGVLRAEIPAIAARCAARA